MRVCKKHGNIIAGRLAKKGSKYAKNCGVCLNNWLQKTEKYCPEHEAEMSKAVDKAVQKYKDSCEDCQRAG